MTWRWPSPKTLRRIAFGIVATLLVGLLLLRIFALTPMARSLVEARIEALTVRGQSVQLDGFKGDLLGRMTVSSLKVQDTDGVWGEATNIELAWGPLGLLSGHLRLNEVTSDAITVSRRPILGPSGSSGSGGSFLKRYTLRSLNVSTLSLQDGIAGPAQTYELTGNLESGGQTGEVALNLAPQEGRGDRVFVELGWGGVVPLTGQADIEGAPGGLIAAILQTPDDASISGSLEASGTLTDWQLTATGAVGGQSILDLEATYRNAEYTANGHLVLAQLDRLTALKSRLGDDITFRGTLDAQQQLVGAVKAGTISSSFAGTVQTSNDSLTIEALEVDAWDVDAVALTRQDGLDFPRLNATGALFLSTASRRFEGELSVPTFAYRDYSLDNANARGSFAITTGDLSADAVLQAEQILGLPAQLQQILGDDVQLDIDARLDRASREFGVGNFVLNSNRAQASGAGIYQLGGAVSMNGNLVLERVAPVERFAGTWSFEGARLSTANVRLNGALSVDQSITALPELIGADSQLTLSVQRQDGDLVLQSAALRSTGFEASASGNLRQGQLAISGNVASPALAITGVNLNQLQAQFDLSGPVAAPILGLTASAADLQSRGRILLQPQISGDIELSGDTAFSGLAKADYLDAPLSLDLDGARRDGVVQLTRLSADWADLQANGAATIDPVDIRASEIDLVVTGSPPTLGEIDAKISYRDEVLDGNVSLQAATFGPIAIERSEISLSGTWPKFTGKLDYDAELPLLGEARSVSGTHGVAADAEHRIVSLDGGFRLADQPFDFITPLKIEADSGLGITGQVAAYEGEIDLVLKPLSEAASSITLSDLALQKFGPLINRPALRGRVNGAGDISLVDGQLDGQVNATITNLARGAPGAPSADLRLAAHVENDLLDATLHTVDSEQSVTFSAQLSAPLAHNGQAFSIRPAPGAAIPVRVQGEGTIAPLWALAAPTNLRLEGDLSIDINNGLGTNWRFQGPVSLENGAFEDGITGLHLREIAGAAALRPDGIDFETARARGRNGGTIEASGLYGFDGNGSVNLQLNRLNAFKRSDVSATVSGRAEIDRRNRRTQVSGDLEIDEARINLEKLPGAGYTTLDVVFTDELDAVESQAPEREAIVLNLGVSGTRRIFVTGSGVDTEWGLNLRITGSPGRPNFIGRANLVRGEADLLSRRFRFSEGRVRFIGAPMDTELTLRADRTSDDITSSITLSGTIMDPEITLSADPSLPNDEILARVLFGRSPSELSPLQAAQLAGAAAQLAGGDALNLVGQLQQATGLDRLDFGLNDEGAATLSTGKYIAEDVYLEIETGGTGAPGVALEWTPLENVAIDAEVDPELGPKVAIQWKRDFDRLPGEPKSD